MRYEWINQIHKTSLTLLFSGPVLRHLRHGDTRLVEAEKAAKAVNAVKVVRVEMVEMVEAVATVATAIVLPLDVVAVRPLLAVVTIPHARTTDVTVVIATENVIETETTTTAADREALPTEIATEIAT